MVVVDLLNLIGDMTAIGDRTPLDVGLPISYLDDKHKMQDFPITHIRAQLIVPALLLNEEFLSHINIGHGCNVFPLQVVEGLHSGFAPSIMIQKCATATRNLLQ